MPADQQLQQIARAALSDVWDPELGLDIVSLGMVHEITAEGRRLRVALLPTSAACPMTEEIAEDVRAALGGVLPGWEIAVAFISEPRWGPERLTPEAREALCLD